jgi:thiamine biosynthesis lipoprotein
MGEPEAVRLRPCFVIGGLLFFVSSSAFALERLDATGFYLGTSVRATICYGLGQSDAAGLAMKKVWQGFADVHAHMNAFDPFSDVSLLNASSGTDVKVHDDVYTLLEKSKSYIEMTRGVFDITIGPLVELWKDVASRGYLPTAEEIKLARQGIGAGRIELLGDGHVRIPSGMKVDLGGNAAGFAADRAVDILRAEGFKDFLVDAGGEIFAAGQACEGRPWRVGVNDPEGKRRWTDVVELKDRAVSTSGNYEKYIEIKGERWSHIINPLTGYPERGVVSATVIAPYAVDADVLSTALCILGPGPGFQLIDALGEGYAALVITEDMSGKLVESVTQGYDVFRVK